MNPPYRADIVGSFLRPEALKAARADRAAGVIDDAALREVEDAQIRDLVQKQAANGLRLATDGEFRRSWWHFDFFGMLDGVEVVELDHGIQFQGVQTKPRGVHLGGKVGFSDTHPMLEHYRFLQSVLVAPVSSSGIVLGKVLGGATLAMMQGLVFLLLAPVAGVPLSVETFLVAAAVLALISFWLTALGLAVAWPMESIQGFHAIMMLFLMPMWLLCGAFFPLEGAPGWLGWVMRLNPLTYGMSAFRQALYSRQVPGIAWDSWSVSLGVTAAVAVALFVLSLMMVGRRTRGSAR